MYPFDFWTQLKIILGSAVLAIVIPIGTYIGIYYLGLWLISVFNK